MYDILGYWNWKSKITDKLYILNGTVRNIIETPGNFLIHLQIKNFFFKNILKKIKEYESTSILEYLCYFYLCEIEGKKIEREIFDFYNSKILNYFKYISSYKELQPLIYTYILKYNQKFSTDKKILIMIIFIIITLVFMVINMRH